MEVGGMSMPYGTDYPEPHDPDAAELLPRPDDPMAVARQLIPEWQLDELLTLRRWRGTWVRWVGTHWTDVDDGEIRSTLYHRTEHATYVKGKKEEPWAPSRRKIGDLAEALGAILHLTAHIEPPTWHDGRTTGPIVSCVNGLLDVSTRRLYEHTPNHFSTISVPFHYDPGAPTPERWQRFLKELWDDDEDSILALQEFFGYVISGRTDLHKILLIVGPTRSGKGTVARVVTALIGKANMAGPTLSGLGTNFGLSPLIGKPLAIVSDARLSGRDSRVVVERLLTISGEDSITVDRKYREPWTGRLPTRFMILSNELPSFGDDSGVIAYRFVTLTLRQSWLGRENHNLINELTVELPGILNWSLDGLERLIDRDRFTEPASTRDAMVVMREAASPISAFIRERCEVGPILEVEVGLLYQTWAAWCEHSGNRPGTVQVFARNLHSVVPGIQVTRPRDGDARERHYVGIALRTNNNAGDRGPSRTTGPQWPDDY
jgi:putative DNA primase/helicase